MFKITRQDVVNFDNRKRYRKPQQKKNVEAKADSWVGYRKYSSMIHNKDNLVATGKGRKVRRIRVYINTTKQFYY